MRDSSSSAGSVLQTSAWADDTESDEEKDEIEEAEKQTAKVTKQMASGDIDDSLETMDEIMQLERVTVAAGAMSTESVDNTWVGVIARSMQ
jgi:hypothetical protein